jgi:hypothetical protein
MGGPSYRTDTKYRQQDGISDCMIKKLKINKKLLKKHYKKI